jgi:chromate transporter
MVTAIADAYVRFGRLPAVGGVLYGVKAVIIAIVVQALVSFARTAIKTHRLLVLGVVAALASALGVAPALVLLVAGLSSAVVRARGRWGSNQALLAMPAALPAPAVAGMLPSLAKLFLIFLKIGSVVFGSGYVLLAFLRTDLVERTSWLTESQLIDAVAVGQFTPGPVFTTATFLGYLVAGIPGAVIATVGIFLPSFVLVAFSGPLIPRLRRSAVASAFLDGVNVAAIALMAVVAAQLGKAAIVDVPAALLAAVSAAVLFRWRLNSAWLVMAGGMAGAMVRWVR